MHSHRTTARGVLLLLIAAGLAGVLAVGAGAHATPPAKKRAVPKLVFPVVGPVSYSDDFGAPRGQGGHEGNDIMAPKRSLAVAVEAGTVKWWTTSARAGCMLYLHGRSGTTYLYVHLNNDRTLRNDNRGGCKSGVAYFPGVKNGAKVQAGQPIAFVGDSGDADGIASHLHFEVHPGGGGAVSPYTHLQAAERLLFASPPGSPFVLSLRGEVVQAGDGSLELAVSLLRRYPGGLKVPFATASPTVELTVPPEATVVDPLGAFLVTAQLADAEAGRRATVWTTRSEATLEAQLGEPLVLAARKIQLGAPAR